VTSSGSDWACAFVQCRWLTESRGGKGEGGGGVGGGKGEGGGVGGGGEGGGGVGGEGGAIGGTTGEQKQSRRRSLLFALASH